MMKKLTFALLCLVMSIGMAMAQATKVTGHVTSVEDGEPVIGASIIVKGTTIGTVTDFDGNFSLEVPANGKILVVSYIGMTTQEVPVSSNVMVKLKSDTQNLDEVVVTAMGISREKKALGYAVQDVKAEKLTKGANSNLAGALQGKVSGMDIKPSSGMPGASSQITIRGARSFTGDNTPLYVVDGMPIASSADIDTEASVTGTDIANRAVDIDPNDIESINVLKGQAASALYGIRASNGVIVITTKSGKGIEKGKPQVSFNTNVSFDVLGRKPQLQQTFAQGTNGTYSPYNSASWGPKISDLANDPTYGGNVANKYNGGDTQKYAGKYYVPQRAAAGIDPWATPQVYDNIGGFFQTGVTWNNSLNVAQATEKASYAFSLGSSTQDGIIPETGMDRYNAKITSEIKLHEQWTTGVTANYINSKIKKMPAANDALLATVYPTPVSYDLNGIPSHTSQSIYEQNSFRSTTFAIAPWFVKNNEFIEKTNRFFGNSFLNFKTKFGTDNHTLNAKYQIGVDSYTTHYQDIWGYGNKGANMNGQVEDYGWSNVSFNSLLTVNYDWTISPEWTLNAILGNEVVHNQTKKYYEFGSSFNFPGWNHIENATTLQSQERQRSKRTVGFFGSVSASYRNMLYLNVTGRNDYVSSMPRNNRSFFYPSVSAGFILTELEPLKNEVVNYAKIRASYAEVGQAGDYYENYYYTPVYGGGFYQIDPVVYPINGMGAFVPYPVIYDPNLKPQNTRSYELGADLNFFNNLVTLNYTFSRQNVSDQIFQVPLAGSTGASDLLTNGGRIHTNAHELTINVNPIRTKNVDWNIGANWTKIDNYVDELAPGVESIFLGGFVTPQVRAGIGDKFPVIYGVGYLRDDKGNLIVDENGVPQAGKDQVIGSVSPDFILGFNTDLRVWKFSLSAVFDWKKGGQMYGGTNGLLDYFGMSKATEGRDTESFIVDGVKADGSKNDIEIKGASAWQNYFQSINNIDEASIYNSSFLKLREIALSYPVLEKKWMSITVNVFARNILLWSEFPNFDPESSQGNNNMTGAFERYSMPQTSSYGFGMNVKF
ncbi:SusC/RagA family TonB-linked outer membrane protein [Parabacteroides chinchillae]|uniref:TonB-linked outer membrane protein, SusC/RagA family n=1 Tax=Parabacteroides chinchillae TaxID=871327 RepID=A0A8G2F3A0_9BACT|nr:SusC/RagA family TonB-linked outer membrane protein [Parabacteroides chinchillae]SEG04573.1 TonB-linked outer membrane protein, SusC/RagA family [Parabacteroides chinchillae]